jgi:hypothetical protein
VSTGRETIWGNKLGRMLTRIGIFPSGLLLDVGTGTGEFLDAIKNYTDKVIGIDIQDYRTVKTFKFKGVGVDKYKGAKPEVVVFKQVFHLIENPFNICTKYPSAIIVLIQMPTEDIEGGTSPLEDSNANRVRFNRLGYATQIRSVVLKFNISPQRYEQMILGGYTTTFAKMPMCERRAYWNRIKDTYDSTYRDRLDILIAIPASRL